MMLAIFIVFFASLCYTADPIATNVQASQRSASSLVEIVFNVKDDDDTKTHVSVEASSDNGETWDIPVLTISGDTGQVSVGEGKRIVWNAGKDWPGQFSANFRIRVIVRDKFCPSSVGDEGMVYIGDAVKRINKKDSVIKPYCIDKWEYPNKRGEMPLTDISFSAASDSCRMRGKRLCAEVQWEAACKGKFGNAFPYGREYQRGKCNTETDEINPIGENMSCVSAYGVYDLSGNIYEWTTTQYSEAIPEKKVIRGGNHYLGQDLGRCTARQWEWQNNRSRQLGFRCCHSF